VSLFASDGEHVFFPVQVSANALPCRSWIFELIHQGTGFFFQLTKVVLFFSMVLPHRPYYAQANYDFAFFSLFLI